MSISSRRHLQDLCTDRQKRLSVMIVVSSARTKPISDFIARRFVRDARHVRGSRTSFPHLEVTVQASRISTARRSLRWNIGVRQAVR